MKCCCEGGWWIEGAVQWLTEEMALILSAWASLWCVVHAYVLFRTGCEQDPVFRAECSKFWKPASISRLWLRMSLHSQFLYVISVSLDHWIMSFVYEFWFSLPQGPQAVLFYVASLCWPKRLSVQTLYGVCCALRPYLSGKEEHLSSLVRYSAPRVFPLRASL